MYRFLFRLWQDEQAQDLTEYALLLVLIALFVAAALPPFAQAVYDVFTNAEANLRTVVP